MPAVADDAAGTGAGVRKPAGKEPAGGARWRCRDRYRYLEIWCLAGQVVIAPTWLVLGERRRRNRWRWCDCEWQRAARQLRRRRTGNRLRGRSVTSWTHPRFAVLLQPLLSRIDPDRWRARRGFMQRHLTALEDLEMRILPRHPRAISRS
jgi:hypothetical protein